MKKIGILTYHRAINYGAFLQCYSLVNYLKDNMPECEIEVIDFETRDEFIIKIKGFIKSVIYFTFFNRLRIVRKFSADLSKLQLSKKHIISNSECIIANEYAKDYDAIIVGSDAIWNDLSTPAKTNFFLTNVNEVKKFSYAASSSGLNINTIVDSKYLDSIRESLQSFKYIGTREDKVDHLVSNIDNTLVCNHTCDPTCLINLDKLPDETLNILKKNNIDPTIPIVCLMTNNNNVGRCVQSAFSHTHQIIGLYIKNKYADQMLYDLSPLDFAVFFKHVDILFSSFFHGCYLSLRNGTPTIAIDEGFDYGEKTKIYYLFERLGLLSYYFKSKEMNDDECMKMLEFAKKCNKTSFYHFINEKLNIESKTALKFIKSIKKELFNE